MVDRLRFKEPFWNLLFQNRFPAHHALINLQSRKCTTMRYRYDQPGVYAIHICGRLDTSWSDNLGGLTITYEEEEGQDCKPVTVLYGWLPDQAALFGILNTLYNLRYPLLFVRYLRPGSLG
jgi:hypothetical protein